MGSPLHLLLIHFLCGLTQVSGLLRSSVSSPAERQWWSELDSRSVRLKPALYNQLGKFLSARLHARHEHVWEADPGDSQPLGGVGGWGSWSARLLPPLSALTSVKARGSPPLTPPRPSVSCEPQNLFLT